MNQKQMKEFMKALNAIAEEKSIIDFSYGKAEEILREHIDKLHSVAKILLEKEKIDGEEFDAIFNS